MAQLVAFQVKRAGQPWGEPVPVEDEPAALAACEHAKKIAAVDAVAVLSRKDAAHPWVVIFNARRKLRWKA